MTRIPGTRINRLSVALMCGVAVAALAGCEDGAFAGFGAAATDAGTGETPAATELVERDVEAPEVFQVSEEGLWDGRPSLGGVWVAHPDVVDPERVIIRNDANGQFVIGALFRRERDNPGPALQVSSDAATALGMLAGSPAQLNVTALRREEAAPEAPGAIPDFATGETVAPAAPDAVTATPLDGPAPDGSAPEGPAPDGAAIAAVGTGIEGDVVADPATAPGLAGDPIASAAAALANASPEIAPAPATASALQRPFLQIGIFSVEENANTAARQMTDAGLAARVVPSRSQGRDFWRVLVGPAATEADRASALEQVQGLGYGDAYAVRD